MANQSPALTDRPIPCRADRPCSPDTCMTNSFAKCSALAQNFFFVLLHAAGTRNLQAHHSDACPCQRQTLYTIATPASTHITCLPHRSQCARHIFAVPASIDIDVTLSPHWCQHASHFCRTALDPPYRAQKCGLDNVVTPGCLIRKCHTSAPNHLMSTPPSRLWSRPGYVAGGSAPAPGHAPRCPMRRVDRTSRAWLTLPGRGQGV